MSQIQLVKRGCCGCKKPIEVIDLHYKFCKDCLVERTETYRMRYNKNCRGKRLEAKFVKACLECNYIFLAKYPSRQCCSNSCLQRRHREKIKENVARIR